MIAIIFEVLPGPGKKQTYLDIAAALKPQLEKIDGFISIEPIFLSYPVAGAGNGGAVFDPEARIRSTM